METEQQKQLRLMKEQANLARKGYTTLQTLVDDEAEIYEGLSWTTHIQDDERINKGFTNHFLARLRLLKRCIVKCHSNDSMDTMCHTKENYTVDEILSDLDECIKHCTDNVNYNPPKYYLRLCNQLYKYYSKYEKSL